MNEFWSKLRIVDVKYVFTVAVYSLSLFNLIASTISLWLCGKMTEKKSKVCRLIISWFFFVLLFVVDFAFSEDLASNGRRKSLKIILALMINIGLKEKLFEYLWLKPRLAKFEKLIHKYERIERLISTGSSDDEAHLSKLLREQYLLKDKIMKKYAKYTCGVGTCSNGILKCVGDEKNPILLTKLEHFFMRLYDAKYLK